MSTLTVYGLEIPEAIHSLDAFRAWVPTLEEHGPRVHFSQGRVHIEMSPQDLRTHEPVIDGIRHTLRQLAREMDLGRYHSPPSWLTVKETDLSTEPDGFLVRFDSFLSGRVGINPERESEMLGAPDMVLEVVSKTSAKKDLVELVEDYAHAGIAEYWTVDARRAAIEFRILVLGRRGRYRAQPTSRDGWVASRVWGRAFRLVRSLDRANMPDYRLESRSSP